MPALYHIMGGDLTLDNRGGLLVAFGAEETRQNIIRALCTNQGAYLQHPSFGASLPLRIGQAFVPANLETLIRSQVMASESVDITAPVNVTITEVSPNSYRCDISYTDAESQSIQMITVGDTGTTNAA